jgi:hypothetical protein
MREFRHVACAMLLVLTSVCGGAQAVPPRVVDSRLRIQTRHAGMVTGRVVRVATDSVVLRDDKTREELAVAQSDVLSAEASTGMPRGQAAQRGALVGAGFGVAVIAAGLLADAKVDGETMGVTNVAIAAPVAVLLTLLGTGIGAALGGEAWQPLTRTHLGSSVQVGRTMSVGIRMSF